MNAFARRFAAWGAAALLAACASTPPPPDWQLNAKNSLERASAAYLSGNSRVEAVEFARARSEIARTGRADLLARTELVRCAARVASLDFDDCPGYAAIAADAAPAERAYANYLAGRAGEADAALLPPAHAALVKGGSGDTVKAIEDPFSRLVAAGVLLRTGRADGAIAVLASETASEQGWSRPLLAWLQLRAKGAAAAGNADEAARLRRRIDLIGPVKAR